ncbi:MAG TPA: prepilin-type N-terminal cleavage/methylation domain-containing protein [Chthoniobacteraceae bacterium]|nr:prepilin-type N-terminal cleavage/methylation domain-containing protein [Chthoniobacteraceae bacterium]
MPVKKESARGEMAASCGREARAFSLVELLVVVGVVSVLLALSISVASRLRDKAKEAGCVHHLRQMGMYIHLYANDQNDYLPPGYVSDTKQVWTRPLKQSEIYRSSTQGGNDDVFYCPATFPGASDETFRRNRMTWGTDFGANSRAFLTANANQPERRLNRKACLPSKILLFDGKGLSGISTPSAHFARHSGRIHYLLLDNRIESFPSMPTDERYW